MTLGTHQVWYFSSYLQTPSFFKVSEWCESHKATYATGNSRQYVIFHQSGAMSHIPNMRVQRERWEESCASCELWHLNLFLPFGNFTGKWQFSDSCCLTYAGIFFHSTGILTFLYIEQKEKQYNILNLNMSQIQFKPYTPWKTSKARRYQGQLDQ